MSEWKKVRLGDIITYKKGYAFKSSFYKPAGRYIVRVSNTTNNSVDVSSCVCIDEIEAEKYKEYELFSNDIIIMTVGSWPNNPNSIVGKVVSVPDNAHRSLLNQNAVRLRANNEVVNQTYLFYKLKDKVFSDYIIGTAQGSANQASITLSDIFAFELDLPPLAEQERIAAMLGALDDKIELNNRINRNLEEQASALFKRWFVDFEFPDTDGSPYKSAGGKFIDSPLGAIPEGWRIGTLSDLIVSTLGGDWGKENAEGNFTKDVYCIRGADIPEVSKGNMGKMPIRYILPKNHAAKKLSIGDIVVEISGGSPTQSTGRVALIGGDFLSRFDKDMVCTNFCRAVKPKEGYSTYIYYLWKYLYAQDVMFSYENGTTGIKNLDINGLLETEQVVIPNIDTASVFTEIINRFNKMIYSNAKQIQSLAHMRDYLLPKLMNKEI